MTPDQRRQRDHFTDLVTRWGDEATATLLDLNKAYDGILKAEQEKRHVGASERAHRQFRPQISRWKEARGRFLAAEMLSQIYKMAGSKNYQAATSPLLSAGENVRKKRSSPKEFAAATKTETIDGVEKAKPYWNAYREALLALKTKDPLAKKLASAMKKEAHAHSIQSGSSKNISRMDRRELISLGGFLVVGSIVSDASKAFIRNKKDSTIPLMFGIGSGTVTGLAIYNLISWEKLPQNDQEFEQFARQLGEVHEQIMKDELAHDENALHTLKSEAAEFLGNLKEHATNALEHWPPDEQVQWNEAHLRLVEVINRPRIRPTNNHYYSQLAEGHPVATQQIQALPAGFTTLRNLVHAHTAEHPAPGSMLKDSTSRVCLEILGHLEQRIEAMQKLYTAIASKADYMANNNYQPELAVGR